MMGTEWGRGLTATVGGQSGDGDCDGKGTEWGMGLRRYRGTEWGWGLGW